MEQTILQVNYKGFSSFRHGNDRFLVLHKKDGDFHIYGENLENYGSWRSADSFKKALSESKSAQDLEV